MVSWNGFVMPAKTPDVRGRFIGLGVMPRASTPKELQRIYDADVARWRKVIADAKISQQ